MFFRQNGSADPAGATGIAARAPAQAAPTAPRLEGGVQAAPKEQQGSVLIVGEGIQLRGEITACDRLVVQGHVEVSLNDTRTLEIAPSGHFVGSCEVEEAEVSGVYQGDLSVRRRLVVRASGHVTGSIEYGEVELERGGRIAGEVKVR